jgi:hypothetical protein
MEDDQAPYKAQLYIGLVFTLQMDRKREVIATFQQLNDFGVYLDIFSLSSYNFLDLLVEMFWVVLISYFGSLELSIDSIKEMGWSI